jgi:hypothetical protein
MTTPPLGLSFPWPHGRSPAPPLFFPGGPSTLPGHGGAPFVLPGFGFGFGVGFGVGCGVARGVARGVGAGVTRGVGAGVMRGVGAGVTRGVGAGVTAGGFVGFVLGGLPDPAAVGRADGARGPMATWPLGSGVTDGLRLAGGGGDGGGVAVPGEPWGDVDVGLGLGPNRVVDGAGVAIGVGDTRATSLGGVRGAPKPTASAKVARTRLRTPRATTSRARWAEVTSLVLSFRPADVGRSALSRMPEC